MSGSVQGASAVATSVAGAFLANQTNFINWEGGFQYGGAVVADGLYEAAAQFGGAGSTWGAVVDAWSDSYLKVAPDNVTAFPCAASFPYGAANNTKACAWELAHNASIEFGGTIGDHLALYPIAYLHRRLRVLAAGGAAGPTASGVAYERDMAVLVNTAERYVLGWPTRLRDGTVARAGAGGGGARTLWADDQFMGLALVSRLASVPRSLDPTARHLPAARQAAYAAFAATQQLSFSRRMRDDDGLYYHGVSVTTTSSGGGSSGGAASAERFMPSCCKWGRANGWGMLSHVEVLTALEAQPQPQPLHAQLLADYQARAAAVLRFQDAATGRWRQVLNESATYLETSSTAMVLTSLATGVRKGWLTPAASFVPAIEAAWTGLASTVNLSTGVVSGVCMGTGIMANASGYNERGTDFFQSSPGGVGAVLRACASYDALMKSLH